MEALLGPKTEEDCKPLEKKKVKAPKVGWADRALWAGEGLGSEAGWERVGGVVSGEVGGTQGSVG